VKPEYASILLEVCENS
jgi:hypothetical protein